MLATQIQAIKSKAQRSMEKAHTPDQTKAEPVPNPAWTRLALGIQQKLNVSTPNDPFEREADVVAERVMRMPEPQIQRQCAAGAAGGPPGPRCEDASTLRRKAPGSAGGPVRSRPGKPLPGSGGGRPLDSASRAFFEPRFGQDFSQVQVHADAAAADAASAVQARAYTLGRDIVFGAGEYAPSTAQGQRLLAHELTHVLQQDGGAPHDAAMPGSGAAAVVSLQRMPVAGQIMRQPSCEAQCGKNFEESGGDLTQRLAALNFCLHQCTPPQGPAPQARTPQPSPSPTPAPASSAAARTGAPVGTSGTFKADSPTIA